MVDLLSRILRSVEQIILQIYWKQESFGKGQFSGFTTCKLYETEFYKIKDHILIKSAV